MIDIKLIEDMKKAKGGNKNATLAALYICNEGYVNEGKLLLKMGLNKNKFRQCLKQFLIDNIVKMRVDEAGCVFYTLNTKYYIDFLEKCEVCPKREKTVKEINGKKYSYHRCLSANCKNFEMFANKNRIVLLRKLTMPVNRKTFDVSPGAEADVVDWSAMEFYSYFVKKYEKTFSTRTVPLRMLVLPKLNELMCLVKNLTGDSRTYKQEVKNYIDKDFAAARRLNTGFSITKMVDSDRIRNFLERNKKVSKKNNIEACLKYGVRCVYFKNGRCIISESGSQCTSRIRNAMKEKYDN